MKIEEINNLLVWNSFFNENGSPSFLQSWEWGELQKNLKYDVIRLGVYENDDLQSIAQVIKVRSRRGNFLFVPHGPIINNIKYQMSNFKYLKTLITQLLEYLTNLAKKEKFSFIRIAPILENTLENNKVFSDFGFKKAPIYMHAERLWVLPLVKSNLTTFVRSDKSGNNQTLSLSDDELQSNMRKTTRYLIRKAQRDGVIIEKRTDEKAIDDFWKIYEVTAERENFVPFSKEFIKKEFETFTKSGHASFFFGNVHPQGGLNFTKSVPVHPAGGLASALVIFTKSTAFYHQGASIHSKIPVTYLLQWEAIKEAKKRGCQFYNFWGILKKGRTPKSWGGLTLFKQGFGGKQIDYLPTQDYIISPKYYLTFIYEKWLGWRRGI